MGRELYEAFPVFFPAFDAGSHAGVCAELSFDEDAIPDRTENAQPALFAVEVSP